MESKDKESSVKAKEVIKSVANTEGMDDANKKAFNILMSGTEKEFIKHLFTEEETGRQRSYAEMRMLYG